jgi:alanine transaminase
MSCVPADGAMYLLPKIDMPQKAVEEAEKRGKKADVMYTLDMLGKSAVRASRRHPLGCWEEEEEEEEEEKS